MITTRQTLSLLTKIVFNTTASRKQTTPKLFRDPKFTRNGIVKKTSKSYDYDLTQPHIINPHLYWNRTINNKILRLKHRDRKFRKLGIRPLYKNGQVVIERPLEEIIKQLKDKRLIQNQLPRTYSNLFEMLNRFPEQLSMQSDLIDFVMNEVEKKIYTMNFYRFTHFCMFNSKLKRTPKSNWFVLFYNHVVSAQAVKKPLDLSRVAVTAHYLLRADQIENKVIMFKDTTPFKMFEDNDPRPKTLDVVLQKMYHDAYLRDFANQQPKDKVDRIVKLLKKVPGNTAERLEAVAH